jgi:signal transduction histidine kinase/ActR/RegA family two-component response regulator
MEYFTMFMHRLKIGVLALAYGTVCCIYIYYLYGQAKMAIDENINNKLYLGALATAAILGETFHDNLVDRHSKSVEEDWQAIQRLTKYKNAIGFAYIYTTIRRKDQVYLVSSSASDEELAKNRYVRFFAPYWDASQALHDSFKKKGPTWVDYTDRWGDFRTVFVPMRSQDGSLYVTGAEISLDQYHYQLRNKALDLAGFSMLIFVAFSLLTALYMTRMRHNINQLRIKEEALKKARDVADSANRAKSEFLATMSHEIRTPMNGIIGAAELLQDTRLDKAQKKYIGFIQTSGHSLLTLINDILDLSKIEAGRLKLKYKTVELHSMIAGTLNIMRPGIKKKAVDLISLIQDDVPTHLTMDVQRLRQVLINLLGNAIKFTPEGTICLTVEVVHRNLEEIHLRFCVHDTGIGISKENLAHLFKPFIQLDASTTRRYGGSGLGLSICNRLVNLMGGEIEVISKLGEGSEFYFTLACHEEKIRESVETTEKVESTSLMEKHIPFKILLAEDNQVNQTIMRIMLYKLGYNADVADHGEAVLAAFEKKEYDIILMDIHMPKMDGVTAAQTLRKTNLKTQPYIIAFTANAFNKDRKKYLASGMNDFLPKPVRMKALANVLQRAAYLLI